MKFYRESRSGAAESQSGPTRRRRGRALPMFARPVAKSENNFDVAAAMKNGRDVGELGVERLVGFHAVLVELVLEHHKRLAIAHRPGNELRELIGHPIPRRAILLNLLTRVVAAGGHTRRADIVAPVHTLLFALEDNVGATSIFTAPGRSMFIIAGAKRRTEATHGHSRNGGFARAVEKRDQLAAYISLTASRACLSRMRFCTCRNVRYAVSTASAAGTPCFTGRGTCSTAPATR